jgi:hypothetical protein
MPPQDLPALPQDPLPRVCSPNAPKGASGAYIWFCQEKRAGVKAKHPAWGIGEIGKELGTEWKALDDKQKEVHIAVTC